MLSVLYGRQMKTAISIQRMVSMWDTCGTCLSQAPPFIRMSGMSRAPGLAIVLPLQPFPSGVPSTLKILTDDY